MRNDVPRVSIGLPVYNPNNFLSPTLDSLIEQTFSDFELIISDNCSTDDTQAICAKFVEQDERIRYYPIDVNLGAAYNF